MKVSIAVNAALVVGCLYLWFVAPEFDEMSVCSRYTQLDREGVINEPQLTKFHPSYGFANNPRRTVPLYIAGPALSSARRTAQLGFAASAISLLTLCATMWSIRKAPARQKFTSMLPETSPGESI